MMPGELGGFTQSGNDDPGSVINQKAVSCVKPAALAVRYISFKVM
jgi:hypothetical protein